MRLYLTSYIDDQPETGPSGQRSFYNGTQSDASKSRVALKKEGMRNIETKDVDVPTDKAGLMAYLNTLFGHTT